MKLDKQLLITHAKRLKVILDEKSTFAPYIARPDFSKVLENALNTLSAAEKKIEKVEIEAALTAKALTKKFNTLGKNSFKLDEHFKYDDESDLIDNINYLSTYCKNIFKVNLDDLVEGKKVTASNPTINLKSKPEPEDMAGAGFAGMGGFSAEQMAYGNPFVMGKAYAKMREDVAKGKIYTYKSKPRIIPYAKWAAIITVGLSIIALIVGAIFAFMSANFQVKYNDGNYYGMKFSATGPGIMYILVACFGAYPLYLLIKSLTSKNDNLRYHFNWPWLLIFIIMILIFVMPDMRVTWLLSGDTIKPGQEGQSVYTAFQGWKAMYIVSQGCAGLCLVPMIIGAVYNPKQDDELIEKKLKEYTDEVMASSGFGVPPSQPSGAEVQKPVEVKKTKDTTKKSDKTSKDKK